MAEFLVGRGVDPSQLSRESGSGSTVENARNVAALIGDVPGRMPSEGGGARRGRLGGDG